MKPRYERRRDQTSRLWRKHRQAGKVRQKQSKIADRNTIKFKNGPDCDTSRKEVSLIDEIIIQAKEAMVTKYFQRHQAR